MGTMFVKKLQASKLMELVYLVSPSNYRHTPYSPKLIFTSFLEFYFFVLNNS